MMDKTWDGRGCPRRLNGQTADYHRDRADGSGGTQSDDAGDAPKTAQSGTRESGTHLKHGGIHLLAIGE